MMRAIYACDEGRVGAGVRQVVREFFLSRLRASQGAGLGDDDERLGQIMMQVADCRKGLESRNS